MHRPIAGSLLAGSFVVAVVTLFSSQVRGEEKAVTKSDVFEIRTYTVEPGKLPDLLTLMRTGAADLIEKHGMRIVGCWTPSDEPKSGDTFIYIVAHDSRDAAKKSWAEFKADPAWPKMKKAAEANGKIFHKIDAVFAAPTDFSKMQNFAPAADRKASDKERVFEIRTYTTEPGKLPDLLKRFRDHTTALFEKHGMTNIAYWVPLDEPKSANTLIYILAHDSRDAAKKSWADFQNDADWKKVKEASEANGKILMTKPESVYATPTDFSPIK